METDRVKRLVTATEMLIAVIEHLDWQDGVCCCGDDMKTHSNPFDSGHSPVDAGEYYTGRALEEAKKVLAEFT